MNENTEIKKKAARLSIMSNSFLILIKITSGIISGSVSIISEAIHSGLDLVASLIAFVAVRISDKPADEQHPYGHGKFENVSGVIESLLIFAAAVWIIYEAVHKMLNPSNPLEDSGVMLGVVIMFLSAVINFFVSRHLYKVAKQTSSVALEADALHLKTDIYTSLGVSLGLLLLYLTSWHFLDALIAVMVALLIIYEAFKMLTKSFNPLLDSNLPKHDIEKIRSVIEKHLSDGFSCKQLRTRQSGQKNIIEFTLLTPSDMSVSEAYKQLKHLKKEIAAKFSSAEIIVVTEPRD